MSSRSTLPYIGALIKAKRREKGLGLRAAAQECSVSASTLSRLERGEASSLPDIDTLTKLAGWLEVSVSSLLKREEEHSGEGPTLTTPEVVAVHLRADKHLSPETANALAEMFQMIYKQFTENQQSKGEEP